MFKIFLSSYNSALYKNNKLSLVVEGYYPNQRFQLMRKNPPSNRKGALLKISDKSVKNKKSYNNYLNDSTAVHYFCNQAVNECRRFGFSGIVLDFCQEDMSNIYRVFSKYVPKYLSLYLTADSDTSLPPCSGCILRVSPYVPFVGQIDEFARINSYPRYILPYLFSCMIKLPDLKNKMRIIPRKAIPVIVQKSNANIFTDNYLNTSFITKPYENGGALCLFDRSDDIKTRIRLSMQHGYKGAFFSFPSLIHFFKNENECISFLDEHSQR